MHDKSVSSAEDWCAHSGELAKVKLCAVRSHSPSDVSVSSTSATCSLHSPSQPQEQIYRRHVPGTSYSCHAARNHAIDTLNL